MWGGVRAFPLFVYRRIAMIPILFEKTETEFNSNGIGRLPDCIYCEVTEERNGMYECEFKYPVNGAHFEDIIEGRIIACTHDEIGDLQAFDIYKTGKVIDGTVTFYARHISYRQNEIAVKPFTSQSCAAAIQAMKTNSINTNQFSYWTDKATEGEYKNTIIRSLRGLLGGEQGSLLDIYGTGEYEWDNFTTKLHLHRGTDTDVEIRYGKNLIDLKDDQDFADTYNAVAPYWIGTEMGEQDGEQKEVSVFLSEWAVYAENSTYGGRDIVVPMDLSGSFQEKPTEAQLRAKAQSYLTGADAPTRNLVVDFVQLWQTEEYASFAPLERCKLCDTVTVIHSALGISTRQKIIKVIWNVLLDRYSLMELGDAKSTYSSLMRQIIEPQLEEIASQLKAVTQVADSTNQYFWHTTVESSYGANDTGAHITEIPREEFMDDPANGGPNLLMRSNGIALRDGITELARFKAVGIQIGADTLPNVELLDDSITFYDSALEKSAEMDTSGFTSYISGVWAAKFKSDGIAFNDALEFTLGNSTTFIKWEEQPDHSFKLKIQADVVEIGGVPALTEQDELTITSIAYAYQLGSSGTTPPSGTWSSSPVASTKTQYAWTRTTVTYSDGHQAISYSVAGLAGQDGQDGQDGHDGSDGQDGTSVSITSTSVKYATSSSGTTAPSSGWSDSVPTVSQGNYLWTRTIVTYSNGSSTTSYSVARQGVNGTDVTSQYMWFNATGTYAGLNIKYTNYSNRININANGISLYDGSSIERARFSSTVRIGEAQKSHAEIDDHSFAIVDKEGTTFFGAKDLRDDNGKYDVTFVVDPDNDTLGWYWVILPYQATGLSEMHVFYDSTEISGYSFRTDVVTPNIVLNLGNNPPASGQTVTINYKTASQITKTYTLGFRKSGTVEAPLSIAMGENSEASSKAAFAYGTNCKASGTAAIAGGNGSEATNRCSAAIGSNNRATGNAAACIGGYANRAEGEFSFATGNMSKAYGRTSFVAGTFCETDANVESQCAVGSFNDPTAVSWSYPAVFMVGNGSGEQYRANAMAVFRNGNTAIAGTLTQASDRRLKEHVRYLGDDAERFIGKLKPVYFRKDGQDHVGFYAQDVEAVDEWHCMTGEMNGFKTLGYMEIIAPLVSYCQSLERRIKDLERS